MVCAYFEEKHEACGVVGIYSKKGEDVAPYLYRALIALQHRGQDAAGFAVHDGKKLEVRRGIGLVDRIFEPKDLMVRGSVGIGHTRYPTYGECRMCDVQPVVLGEYAAAHNGHIANAGEARKDLKALGCRFTSSLDSEIMVQMMQRNGNAVGAVKDMMTRLEGSFSVAALAKGKLMIFRDRFAIRPLVWGENERFLCFASETVALDINGIPHRGDVRGGELVTVEAGGKLRRQQLAEERKKYCMFEYVYFSRPDSVINDRSVYEVRKRLGETLARESPVKADVVVPVPDTSRIAASSYANILNIPCEEGLIKNRYIGRTFIMPNQGKREEAVVLKINPIKQVVEGKGVVLIDDSIVRGTTLKRIIAITRAAGAAEVHVRITCPPIKAPCFYGVDMSTYSELIADRKDVEGIGRFLGADSLAYLSIKGLERAIGLPICTACLGGDYHTEFVRALAESIKRKESGKKQG